MSSPDIQLLVEQFVKENLHKIDGLDKKSTSKNLDVTPSKSRSSRSSQSSLATLEADAVSADKVSSKKEKKVTEPKVDEKRQGSPVPDSEDGKKGEKPLEAMTKSELVDNCKEEHISGYSLYKSKADLMAYMIKVKREREKRQGSPEPDSEDGKKVEKPLEAMTKSEDGKKVEKPLEAMTKSELVDNCKEEHISGYSLYKSKADLMAYMIKVKSERAGSPVPDSEDGKQLRTEAALKAMTKSQIVDYCKEHDIIRAK